jgi:two-component system, OmpR family, copper resistance phosphate regulon response regulator CusR
MRILVIEDEKKAADYLKKGLTENGFVVDVADNGVEGLHYAENQSYDCVILDVMLPKMDGWQVIENIRKDNRELPVLMLTARDMIEDRVKGLSLGADDYLLKPYAFSELLARIHALIRRGKNQQQQDHYDIGNLHIDLRKQKVTRKGKRIDLTPKEFTLLSFLARHEGEVMSRTLISEQVWGMNFDSDTNIVDVALKRLRDKIDGPFDEKLIHTVRGVGYVLEK